MTVGEALRAASATLAVEGFEDASLEAEVLLMHVLGVDRARLYARLGEALSDTDAAVLTALVARRVRKEPVAYITGHREFFGFDFSVAPGALIPRPESELLVEEALDFVRRRFPQADPLIADAGTGSGALAVTLALLLPKASVYGTDISVRALEIARVNCERHGVQGRVHLLEGELLCPLPGPVDVIVGNLPYVSAGEMAGLSEDIRLYEPVEALAGGEDGLDRIRRLLSQVGGRVREGGVVLLEVGHAQAEAAAALGRQSLPGAGVELVKDLGGVERVVKIHV